MYCVLNVLPLSMPNAVGGVDTECVPVPIVILLELSAEYIITNIVREAEPVTELLLILVMPMGLLAK
jgi:hypothetical protein